MFVIDNTTSILFSDGVGRSGTYVLIDMVLNRMNKGSKEIDIAATLEHIRDQRSGQSIFTCTARVSDPDPVNIRPDPKPCIQPL